jgi:small conductance mechanosensitive channel
MGDLATGFVNEMMGTSQVNMLEQLGSIAAKVTLALAIVVVALIVATRIRNWIYYVFKNSKGDLGLAILLGRFGYVCVLVVGVLLVLPIFGLNPTAVFATVGVIGLGVSLAMQDVLKNVFAGVYLLVERPFRPGETIKVRDFVGTVETVNLRTTTLRAAGEVVFIPNAILFAEILINRGLPQTSAKEIPE